MATTVIDRAAVFCFDCGFPHQLRLIERQGAQVAVFRGKDLNFPPIKMSGRAAFDLASRMIETHTEQRGKCPLPKPVRK